MVYGTDFATKKLFAVGIPLFHVRGESSFYVSQTLKKKITFLLLIIPIGASGGKLKHLE
jgi:hypothetical protein